MNRIIRFFLQYESNLHVRHLKMYAMIGFIINVVFYMMTVWGFGLQDFISIRVLFAIGFMVLAVFPNDQLNRWQRLYYEGLIAFAFPMYTFWLLITHELHVYYAIHFMLAMLIYSLVSKIFFGIMIQMLLFIYAIISIVFILPHELVEKQYLIGLIMIGALTFTATKFMEAQYLHYYEKNKSLRLEAEERNKLFSALIYISSELAMYEQNHVVVQIFVERLSALLPKGIMGMYVLGKQDRTVICQAEHGLHPEENARFIGHMDQIIETETLPKFNNIGEGFQVFEKSFVTLGHENFGPQDTVYHVVFLLKAPDLNPFFSGVLQVFLETVSNHLKSRMQAEELKYFASRDLATGLFNRQAYILDFADIVKAYDEVSLIGVLVVDINGLKRINDRYGHEAGDAYVKGVADAILSVLPDYAKAYRYGGDEIAVLVLDCREMAMERLSEVILVAIQDKPMRLGPDAVKEPMEVAIGHACSSEMSLEGLFALADQRMMANKEEFYNKHPEINRRG